MQGDPQAGSPRYPFPELAMSSRARKRHERSNGSVLKKILLGFGVVLVVIGIAAGAAAGWVYDMWNDAGTIDEQKIVGEEAALRERAHQLLLSAGVLATYDE